MQTIDLVSVCPSYTPGSDTEQAAIGQYSRAYTHTVPSWMHTSLTQ